MLQSRRLHYAFLTSLIISLPTSGFSQVASKAFTAAEVIARVIAATGATPPACTVDTQKAGDRDTIVTGIVTTFMDTNPVLEQVVASGKKLIITHEPTFYKHLDDQSPRAGDQVLRIPLGKSIVSPIFGVC